MQIIVDGWWKVSILLVVALVFIWGATFALSHILKKAKESGVEEISAGPAKIDFDKDDNPKE